MAESDEPGEIVNTLSHASVLYTNEGFIDTIPTCDFENFFPRDAEDFDRQKKYKYWLDDGEFIYINILRLGCKHTSIVLNIYFYLYYIYIFLTFSTG